MSASASSFLFWVNAFVWTFRQKEVDVHGNEVPVTGPAAHVPFITWPVQDEVALDVIKAIETGEHLNIEKSRDMGASWLLLSIFDWMFLFRRSVSFGVVSRKEDVVDKAGDMDTLFEKIRYIHRMLPAWMCPRIRDAYMYLHNLSENSTIVGESTNTNVGRGGRKTAYFVDEAASIPNAEMVEASLSQNTPCQLWGSTPAGPNTVFHQRIKEKRGRLIQMPWWRHPEKALHAHQVVSEDGKIKWTSPWYSKLPEKFSRKTIAREVDMDHGQAGDIFFDFTELERHRRDHETEPLFRGDLIFKESMTDEAKVEIIQQMNDTAVVMVRNHGRKPWRIWMPLEKGRPAQWMTYVFGCDISNGAGNSNSVITVRCLESGQIVAKWWDAYTSPEEMAIVAAISGVWFGGSRPPAFVCWENNGPGGIFGRKLVDMCYPHYYRQRIDNTIRNTKTPRWGWNSNAQRKEVLLGLYRDALGRDAIINPCKESLDEAADYIYDQGGSLIPSRLREESGGGRQLHGDHVIADALTVLAGDEMPVQREQPAKAPSGTYAHRRQRFEQQQKESDPWR